ncbi:MAG: 3'-5' exonuclease [Elusimicrobiales bacterium]|nr:3'-5' exonuclease [Elusimicrobiales bacterium]
MKNYIVFDLEWNQSPHGKADSVEDFPFEIIEIGAVKLDEQFHKVDEFHRLIRPQVYKQMHYAISEVTHMDMGELRDHGEAFELAAQEFFVWSGEEPIYCTWGSMDLTELQRNLKYFGMENPFPKPLFYYDVQKLYGLFYRGGAKPSLDAAVEELNLLEDRPFHRALDDAYYTGKVLAHMSREQQMDMVMSYKSIDYYRLPAAREEEIRIVFPNYSKYVSRIFNSKEDAMQVRSVTEMKCYRCGRALRKKVRWFTPNQKVYYGLAICPEHGYLKGKIRMKRVDDTRVFAVKTLKLTDEEGAAGIVKRKEEAKKRRTERNKAKKLRDRETKKS